MWKTTLLALIAFGLASPCDVTRIDAYRVLLAHAAEITEAPEGSDPGEPLRVVAEEEYDEPEEGSGFGVLAGDSELGDALAQLGICKPEKSPGPVTRFLVWVGLSSSPRPEPTRWTIAIRRLPDDRVVVATVPMGIRNIRDCNWITLHVVNERGRVVTTGEFSAGYGYSFPCVTPGSRSQLEGSAMIALASTEAGGLRKRQYYALRNDRFVLVRLEEFENREIRKNHYGAPNYTVGPDVPELDANGWSERLASDDPVTLLEALVWLGGVHLDVHRDPPDSWHEDPAAARIWDEIVTDELTKVRLRKLAGSTDPWIAEAARCTMEIERYR